MAQFAWAPPHIALTRQTLKPGSWRLFRYVHTDHVRGYTEMSRKALGMEALSDAMTMQSMYLEAKEHGQ